MTMNGAIITLARYRAKQLVKQRLWDRGIKLSTVTFRDVIEAAEVYIAEHPEILDEAREMIRQSPRLQRLIRPRQRLCETHK
jgi:hypothetical protein